MGRRNKHRPTRFDCQCARAWHTSVIAVTGVFFSSSLSGDTNFEHKTFSLCEPVQYLALSLLFEHITFHIEIASVTIAVTSNG